MINPVSTAMREVIARQLRSIAAEEEVTILFAIESGSRARGFHSRDSASHRAGASRLHHAITMALS